MEDNSTLCPRRLTCAKQMPYLWGNGTKGSAGEPVHSPRRPPMNLQLGGIHHLTAVTAQAAKNLQFYTQTWACG